MSQDQKAKNYCFFEILWSVHLWTLPKKGGHYCKREVIIISKLQIEWLFLSSQQSLNQCKKAKKNCFSEILWSVHLCPLPKKGGMLLKKRSWTRPKLTPLKANLSRRLLKKNGDFFVWGPRSLKFGFLVEVYVYINNLGSNLGSLTQKRRKSLFSFWAKWLFLSCY